MPSPAQLFDDRALRSFYDAGAIGRGRAYADEGRIGLLGGRTNTIRAVCRGSGQNAYLVDIEWTVRGGAVVDLIDDCSCPLGGACKHCVAAILTAVHRGDSVRDGPGGGAVDDPLRSRWRDVLAGLPLDGSDLGNGTAFAVQIAIERPRVTRYDRGDPRLTMRPLRTGRRGWVKTGASWRDLLSPYARQLDDGDAAQRGALRSLALDHQYPEYAVSAADLPADGFTAGMWPALDRAVAAGVALVDADGNETIELVTGAARVEVDLTTPVTADDPDAAATPADDGDVVLSAALVLGDEHIDLTALHLEPEPVRSGSSWIGRPWSGAAADPAARLGYRPGAIDDRGRGIGTIGSPVHGIWVADGGRVRLIRMARPLLPPVVRLLAAGPLDVPGTDVDELLDVFEPVLSRHAAVGSSDESVAVTSRAFAGLVLDVRRPAIDTAELAWRVRYRRGRRVADHPLLSPPAAGRDREAEAAALDDLELPVHLLADLVGPDGRPRDLTVTGSDTIALLADVLPWLEAKGQVVVEVHGDEPELREAVDEPQVSLTVTDGGAARDGNDWFDLQVEVQVDGQVVDFVSLFAALNADDEVLILPSGTWLRLDRPELIRLRELIEEARGLAEPDGDAAARVNPFQVDWWDELASLGVVTEQSQRWGERIARLSALAEPEPVPVPAGLAATLRPYQQEGLDWLAFLHANGLGGILADDMGLGKTVQTLALCLHVLEQRPDARFLVVAPTSVVENWARETGRFAPGVEIRAIRGTEARRGTPLAEAIDGASIVVTSYALFRLEFEAYAQHDWELLLLDEAQFVKNHQGKTHHCVRRLDAATKIAITGTPLENTLMDLWSLLSITAPGLYPDPKRFSETYRKPIESGDAPQLLATLKRRIAPLMRRRTKDAVLTELPPKTEQVVEVPLSPRHSRIYGTQLQRQRQKVLGLVGDVDRNRFEILKSLTLLRQLALDPGLVDPADEAVGSAKLDRLIDDLTQVVAEGHRALVFSQFTRYLAKVRTRLDAAGIEYAYLDGRTRRRDEAIARFKDGGAPVFVISLKAGGFGLNLTEADYCFVLDPWWNPATETQAVDRAHRIGQTNPVVVYRYVSVDTIEEKVMQLKERKAKLFAKVMDADGGALSGAISADDIRGLLDL